MSDDGFWAGWRQIMAGRKIPLAGIAFFLILAGVGLGLFLGIRQADLLDRLRDLTFARGLITFIVTVTTVGIALLLVYQAFYAEDGQDRTEKAERFRRAREIFSGLMGVLGTIVGFYFGTATTTRDLRISETRLVAADSGRTRVEAYVYGGTPPYRYTVSFEPEAAADSIPAIAGKVTVSGWISEAFVARPGMTVRIEVLDKEERRAAASAEVPAARRPPPAEPGR
ncbi:MAG: hypothetical protein ACOY71_13925 [Gemmatimonadota bacterium]